MKKIDFRGASLNKLKSFNDGVKQDIGHQLYRVQMGLEPEDSKPMKTIEIGVKEIRVKDKDGIYRCIYIAKFAKIIYVLDCFQKKTEKTPDSVIKQSKKRLKEIYQEQKNVRKL
ncbi:hypothetical protein MNBD_GAMMA01-2163 [hydrothermal vent metagenome]|uniref:Phage-related protein n=1 Tax=hydrothermal vent metagenome TaxID=652676 RepID=A0A3B0V1P7_9ZZZZ